MRSNVEQNNLRQRLMHDALKYMARLQGRTFLDMSMEEIAHACHVSTSFLLAQFNTLEELLVQILNRMRDLFTDYVKNPVMHCAYKKKNKIEYFLLCVKELFTQFPETGYLFTMCFLIDIVTSDFYVALEDYFSDWHETLYACLQEITHDTLARRITDLYLTSLKGRLQLDGANDVLTEGRYAQQFLHHFITHSVNI